MRFIRPTVTINQGDLNRRVLKFYFLDHEMVLDYDADESRETKRHKWRVQRKWSRLDKRNNTMERRDVPESAIEASLQYARDSLFTKQSERITAKSPGRDYAHHHTPRDAAPVHFIVLRIFSAFFRMNSNTFG